MIFYKLYILYEYDFIVITNLKFSNKWLRFLINTSTVAVYFFLIYYSDCNLVDSLSFVSIYCF